MLKKIYKLAYKLLISSIFLLSFASLVFFIFNTEKGANLTIKTLAKALPGETSIDKVHGILIRNIKLEGIHHKDHGVDFHAENIEINIEIKDIINGQLSIPKITAQNIKITAHSFKAVKQLIISYTDKRGTFLSKLNLPINLSIKNVQVDNVEFNSGNTTKPLVIKKITFNCENTLENSAKGIKGELISKDISLKISGKLSKEYVINYKASIPNLNSLDKDASGEIAIDGKIQGESDIQKIEAKIKGKNLSYKNSNLKKLDATINTDINISNTSSININAYSLTINKNHKINNIALTGTLINKDGNKILEINLIKPLQLESLLHDRLQKIVIKDGILNAVFKNNSIETKITLNKKSQHPLNILFTVPNYNELKFSSITSQKIYGEISWKYKNLEFLRTLLPQIKKPNGEVTINCQLSGTISKPTLKGSLKLDNFSGEMPDLKLHLYNGKLNATTDDGKNVSYDGKIYSGEGNIGFKGKINLKNPKLETTIDLVGDNFLTVNNSNAKIITSPKLQIKISQKRIDAVGTIFIPKANLEQQNYSELINLPEEIEFVSEEKTGARFDSRLCNAIHKCGNDRGCNAIHKCGNDRGCNAIHKCAGMTEKDMSSPHICIASHERGHKCGNDITHSWQPNTYSKVKLIFGDNVMLNTMGLKGLLRGELQINDTKTSTLASGTLMIQNGTYNLYGQPLNIDNGRLYFSGSPINNPSINIEVVRTFKNWESTSRWKSQNTDLTVGIRMYGPLNAPKTNLFSSVRSLQDTDIFSYLIVGQSSTQAPKDKLQLVLKAAEMLKFSGLKELNQITSHLQQKLGLSQFGLETQMTSDEDGISQTRIHPMSDKIKNNDIATNVSFVLGKYLSPKLYIGYSYRFIDQVKTLKVNYILGKFWTIQSEADALNSGVDLLYRIEK